MFVLLKILCNCTTCKIILRLEYLVQLPLSKLWCKDYKTNRKCDIKNRVIELYRDTALYGDTMSIYSALSLYCVFSHYLETKCWSYVTVCSKITSTESALYRDTSSLTLHYLGGSHCIPYKRASLVIMWYQNALVKMAHLSRQKSNHHPVDPTSLETVVIPPSYLRTASGDEMLLWDPEYTPTSEDPSSLVPRTTSLPLLLLLTLWLTAPSRWPPPCSPSSWLSMGFSIMAGGFPVHGLHG